MMFINEIRNGKQTVAEAEILDFDKEYDVIVVGLGSAGALSALFSAENGLSVLGIESLGCVGGTHTAGGITGHYFGCPGGRYLEKNSEVSVFKEKYTCTAAEAWKLVIEKQMTDAGVEIIFESSVCGVYTENDSVVGAKVFSKGGFINIGCRVMMDCTGDVVVAHMAGCSTEYGRGWDGQTQPYSMVSMVFDGTRYKFTNIDFGRVDQRDDKELSDAYIFSRAFEMAEERRNLKFVSHMPLIGIREGRRIVAEEMIITEDLFAEKQTKTPVFYSYADLDKHGWDIAFDGEILGDWAIGANLGAYNVTVAVSFKSLIPKGLN